MHRLLRRQLKKLELDHASAVSDPQWTKLLELISTSYQQADDDRYLLERSLQISSDEMQVLMQQQKASAEGRMEALLNAIPDVVFMIDSDGCYLEVMADDFSDLYLPPNQLKGQYLQQIMPPEQSALFMDVIHKAISENQMQFIKYDLLVAAGKRTYEGRVVYTGHKVNNRPTVLFLARDITELNETHRQLEYNASHDALTGLPNRVLLYERVVQTISRSVRHGSKAALMLMDLDRFKHINDSLGHSVGDRVLKEVTRRLVSVSRAEDSVFRFGGDEFILIIEDLMDTDSAGRGAKRILDVFAKPIIYNEMELDITASIGISIIPDDGDNIELLLKQADSAMYAAKEEGRSQYQFYSADLGKRSFTVLSLETDLRKAILNQELTVHYQPQYRLSDHKLIGVEALVRWPTAPAEFQSPAVFIPIAEMSGLIELLGQWVIHESCRVAKRWIEQQRDFGRVSINLSSRQLSNPGLAVEVSKILQDYELDGSRLEFEITESMVIHHGSVVHDNLDGLSRLGIELAIDDFGTGHSSLINLKRFPLNRLKIDRSFVNGLGKDANDEAITSASIALARQLGYQVVAEGVETQQQLDFLDQNQCDFVQGYLFSRPLPEEEVVKLIPLYQDCNLG